MRSARTNQTCDWTWHHGYICWRHFSLAFCWLRVTSWGWGPSLWDWMCWMSWVILSSYSQTCASGSEEFCLHVLWFYDSSLLLIVISSAQNRSFFWNLLKVNVKSVQTSQHLLQWNWTLDDCQDGSNQGGHGCFRMMPTWEFGPHAGLPELDPGRSRGMDISTLPEAESTTWTLVFSHRLSKVRQSWQGTSEASPWGKLRKVTIKGHGFWGIFA